MRVALGNAHLQRAALAIAATLAIAAGPLSATAGTPAGASTLTNPKHFFWAKGQTPPPRPAPATRPMT